MVTVRATTSGALIAMADDVVVKLHAPGTERAALAARLHLAADRGWRDCLLAPLVGEPVAIDLDPPAQRWATVWPRVDTVPHDPETVPWALAGERLARLHQRRAPGGLPAHGAVRRLERGLRRLRAVGPLAGEHARARDVVEVAAASLPGDAWRAWTDGRPRSVVHGDWHLGQLGRLPAVRDRRARAGEGDPGVRPEQGADHRPEISRAGSARTWLLIDVDDLGVGDPAWDLERPAAMWAAGILPDEEWRTFVGAYVRAGGTALPPGTDGATPWGPVLDAVARAGVVQAAAGAVRRAVLGEHTLDEIDETLLATCARLGRDAAHGG